ncbi:MAG: UDP-2,3-diacylglucosamine diphosphatase LpxI [Rhizobiales bacterium]|nr:UDP-2,3-diacylglucosamine diphosphatase LpxI [Hyphomicrobiales bacterium]
MPPARQEGPLALICGGGSLPLAVADFVSARGRQVLLFPLRGVARPEDYAQRPHTWIRLAKFGVFARAARAAGCHELVLIGSLVRPAFWQIRFDLTTLKLLPRIAAAYRGGDDHLLSSGARLIEEQGFRVLGAHEVAPEILVPEGPLGHVQVGERDRADIALGLDYLHATGPFDVGQAVVVAGRHVLAVEAAEGTDQMLERIAALRASGHIRASTVGGVLVKAPKRGQDRRFDLPSIGPQTVEGIVRAGLAGIAVAAGETIVAEPSLLVQAADRAKIFVVGVPSGTER